MSTDGCSLKLELTRFVTDLYRPIVCCYSSIIPDPRLSGFWGCDIVLVKEMKHKLLPEIEKYFKDVANARGNKHPCLTVEAITGKMVNL